MLLSELLYLDDIVLIIETTIGLKNKFTKLKKAFDSKALNVNHSKTKAVVN